MTGYLETWRTMPSVQRLMLAVLAAAVVLANIDQPYPEIAPLQHVPSVLLILAAPLLLGRFPLSNRSVAALTAFFLLHTLAGRYTYSNVPYDTWAKSLTGHTVSAPLSLQRNEFDRLVHLSFGLLWVGPFAEVMRRHAGLGRRASLWTALLFVGAFSAAYEIFEWLLTLLVAPGMADDYNGQQGDPWDAQKDMALAIAGAVVSSTGAAWRSRPGGGTSPGR